MIDHSSEFLPTIPLEIDANRESMRGLDSIASNRISAGRTALSKLWRDLNIGSDVRPIDSVSSQPFTRFDSWRVYRVYFSDGSSSSHLVGSFNNEVRVTTAVQSIDPLTRRAVTATGRTYLIGGEVGCSGQAKYLFKVWLKGRGAIKVIDQTESFLAMQNDGRGRWQAVSNFPAQTEEEVEAAIA